MAVALLRIADERNADRGSQQTQQSTTAPSAGFDRQPTGGESTTSSPTTTAPDDEGPAVVLEGDGIGAFPFGADPD